MPFIGVFPWHLPRLFSFFLTSSPQGFVPEGDKQNTGNFCTVEDRMSASSVLQGQIALLLQQQLIGQLSNMGDGVSLTETLLQRHRKSGREISAEAITGRLRSDVGALRQSARNLREGGGIAEIAKTGVSSIVGSLEKMLELAKGAATDLAQNPGAERGL